MAKGRSISKVIKGANGRKNHGPKRHLDHDIRIKATRARLAKDGLLNKYHSYDGFCLALQARGIRSEFKTLWSQFCAIPEDNHAAQRDFFKNLKK